MKIRKSAFWGQNWGEHGGTSQFFGLWGGVGGGGEAPNPPSRGGGGGAGGGDPPNPPSLGETLPYLLWTIFRFANKIIFRLFG